MLYVYDNRPNIIVKKSLLDEASEKDESQSNENEINMPKYFHQELQRHIVSINRQKNKSPFNLGVQDGVTYAVVAEDNHFLEAISCKDE